MMQSATRRKYSKVILKRIIAGGCCVLAGTLMVAPLEAATLTVKNLDDSGAESLRQCVQDANNGDEIVCDGALAGTIVLTGGAINLASDLTIAGPGSGLLAVSGGNAARIFTATNVNIAINGVTFINGLADGLNGGVLIQEGGSAVFSNCLFVGNTALGAAGQAGGFGGAIYATGAVLSLYGCVFSNNTATGPGGLPVDVGSYSGGGGGGAGLGGAIAMMGCTGVIAECVFGRNSVTGGVGGTAGWDSSTEDGGKGGGPDGGAGGIVGHLAGYEGGLFSGGGGGRIGSGTVGGNGGFGGGGGGSGAYNVGTVGGAGGQYGGSGSFSIYSAGGGGGGGAGLGGAIFIHNGVLAITNSWLAGNTASGGAGGGAPLPGTNGMGAGGALFAHGNSLVSLYQAFFSGNTANAYPDVHGALAILGTNGALVANGEGASVDKGTDMGSTVVGMAMTNVLTLANNWTNPVTISSVTTNGAGASSFLITGIPAAAPAGASIAFKVIFTPIAEGAFTCMVSVVNSSGSTPYLMALSGTGIPKLNQVINNMLPASGSAFVVSNKATLSAQASSGLAVGFQVRSGPAALSGGTNLTFSTSGQVVVVASQAGNAMWNPAPAVTGVYNVSKAGQTISFPAIAAQNPTNKVALSATASSGLPVSFSVASGPGRIASGVLSFSGTGVVRVVASQAGNTAFDAARPVTNAVTCVKAAQTISFPAIAAQNPTNKVALSATASSGLPVSFSVASGPGRIASGVLSFSGTGVVRVVARQAGDALYLAAKQVTNAVTVRKRAQTITFPAIPEQKVKDTVTLSATASSGLPVSFSVASGPGRIAAGVLSFSGTGVVRVVARQAGNTAFDLAKPVTNRVVVTASGAVINDYDGNGISELAVYDNNIGSWYAFSLQTGKATIWNRSWGWAGAETVPGDYDGDAFSDMAVFDQNTGLWYVWSEARQAALLWARAWGWPGAETVCGDYDGDAKSDLAVYDQPSGFWYIITMGDKILAWAQPLGCTGAITVPGDYDGDGLNDLCVYDQNTGLWYVQTMADKVLAWELPWGWAGATAVPGDYDADGLSDMAVYDQPTGAWYVWSQAKQKALIWNRPWGWTGAVPVPGDYDGDKNADLAVFDTITGSWYVWSEVKGQALVWAQNWGWAGANPPGGRK